MIEINLANKAISQHTINFNSMCNFNGNCIGASDSGLHKIAGFNDNGVQIPALIKSGKFNLGTDRPKRFRAFYFELECTGDLLLSLLCDNEEVVEYSVDANDGGIRRIKVPIGSNSQGHWWEWKVENVNGSFFALYSVKALPIIV